MLGFSVEIQPCSYPLVMKVVVERTDAPQFTQTVGIQNSGHVNLILPTGVNHMPSSYSVFCRTRQVLQSGPWDR